MLRATVTGPSSVERSVEAADRGGDAEAQLLGGAVTNRTLSANASLVSA